MPLSIDEEESRCTKGWRNKAIVDGREEKRSLAKLEIFYEKFTKPRKARAGKHYQNEIIEIMKNQSKNQEESRRNSDSSRNIPGTRLVYTSAAGRAAQATQRIYKKNPAGAAAGR
jgi:hypothetical protein